MSVLSGRQLACRRGGRVIFRQLDFTVPAGGALLLRGPNGSGKSSLLRCLAGLLPVADGLLAWDGRPILDDREDHNRQLRYVGHQDAVKSALSVAENLLVWTGVHGLDQAAVGPALSRLGLAGLSDMPAQMLSAGLRRRLALARLALAPARLWLLDEPTTSLDDESAGRFIEMVSSHRQRGGMVVLSSHGDPGFDATQLDMADFRAPAAEEAA
jgi:heme exporter protein A